MMVKQSTEKQTPKSNNLIKLNEQNGSIPLQNITEIKKSCKNIKNKEANIIKSDFIKKECVLSVIDNIENFSNYDNIENISERSVKLKKKISTKISKEMEDCKNDIPSDFSQVKLSHTVIVNSVLKVSKIDQNVDAILPESLNNIYKQFINSKKYIESLHNKDDFFCGVGLLGVNIEEQIYNKRKALEDSLRRGIRLRPNPKPTKLFDGTVINRPARNTNNASKAPKPSTQPIVLRGKTKYNLFNIGNDVSKKKSRRPIRKPLKKKLSCTNRATDNQKFSPKKEVTNANSASSDDDSEITKSIAATRPKRQQKVPKLDFKYCYGDRVVARNRKYADSNSDGTKSNDGGREFLEIIDSDSSSVVEVSPPNDVDFSNDSDEQVGKSRESDRPARSGKSTSAVRRGWRPKESKALNLLDKLRLGLQCTIIHTEHDIIIQNLSLDDLATLQSRLQGLATFKNIEAEYDKNGQETARATIDRKLLKLPLKSTETGGADNKHSSNHRRYDDSLKRKLLISQLAKSQPDRKKIALSEKPVEDIAKSFNKVSNANNSKIVDECAAVWMRPKGRSVKKVRKLYTQSGSTPNILSRSQMPSRSDKLISSSSRSVPSQTPAGKSQSLTFSQTSNLPSMDQHSTTSVSFYSQLSTMSASSSSMGSVPLVAKPAMVEPVKPIVALTNSSTSSVLVSVTSVADVTMSTAELPCAITVVSNAVNPCKNTNMGNTVQTINVTSTSSTPSTSIAVSLNETAKKPITVETILPTNRVIDLVSPATAMSASQLLMLKRGGAQTSTTDTGITNSMVGVVTGTDQLYTNQILKPFKKTLTTSSPPKLELDDEEVDTDFELPTFMTQVKNVSVPNYQSIQNKNNFLSKPLIQSSGILSSSRRTISLANTPLFQAQNALISTPSQLTSSCVTVSSKPMLSSVSDKPPVCVVSAQPVPMPMPNSSGITTTVTNCNIVSNNQSTTPIQNSNLKIKHRKWTHNFHTSNSINFREMLCTTTSGRGSTSVQSSPNLNVQVQQSTNPLAVGAATVKQITVSPIAVNSNVSSNVGNISLRITEKPIAITPNKGSSAVLKSLLVGSNTSNELCSLNKATNWASKYLSSTSTLQDSSKIKWQVGGTVITSSASILSSSMSKETIPNESANSNNSK